MPFISEAHECAQDSSIFEVVLASNHNYSELMDPKATVLADDFVASRGRDPRTLVAIDPPYTGTTYFERRFRYRDGIAPAQVPIDRKYRIRATSTEHGTVHTDLDAVLFLAKDRALPDTLRFYRDRCAELGADERQLQGVSRLIDRVEAFQSARPDLTKVADVDVSVVGDQIIA